MQKHKNANKQSKIKNALKKHLRVLKIYTIEMLISLK